MTDNWIIDDTESRQFAQAIHAARTINGGQLAIERSANGLWRIEFGSRLPEADPCTAYFASIAEAACDAIAASTGTIPRCVAHKVGASDKSHDGDRPAGECPHCGRYDAVVNVRRMHYAVCHAHRTYWVIGENLFSSWHNETAETWKANIALLANYTSIEPGEEMLF